MIPLWGNSWARPSLDINFLSGSLDSRITFTRAGNATYYNSSGLIQSAGTDVPRFDYDPYTLQPKGLLLEPAATNLCLQSEAFATTWTVTNATITSNVVTSPDGLVTADKAGATATNTTHLVQQTIAFANATIYTFSVYAKAAEESRFVLRVSSATTVYGGGALQNVASFDLLAVTANPGGVGTSASITPVGNGWYRCVCTASATVAAGNAGFQFAIRQGTAYTPTAAGDGLYLWGAQMEATAGTNQPVGFASSYIPTTTASASRAADSALMTSTNFSDWYNPAQGTIWSQAVIQDTSTRAGWSLNDATTNNRIYNGHGASPRGEITTGGASQMSQAPGTTSSGRTRAAVAYELNNSSTAYRGTANATDTSCTMPSGLTRATLGTNATTGNPVYGWLQQITYYPSRVANDQIANLTSGISTNPYVLSAIMTEGTAIIGSIPYYGFYSSSPSFGSMSSTSITGGLTLVGIYDADAASSAVIISGFTSDPGRTPFAKVVVGNTVRAFSAADYYNYDSGSGTASWAWTGLLFGLDGSGTSYVVISE